MQKSTEAATDPEKLIKGQKKRFVRYRATSRDKFRRVPFLEPARTR